MEVSAIIEIVSAVGFPIVIAIWVIWQSNRDKDRLYDALDVFGKQLAGFNETLVRIDNRLEQLEKTE